jgi:hypothetical protein
VTVAPLEDVRSLLQQRWAAVNGDALFVNDPGGGTFHAMLGDLGVKQEEFLQEREARLPYSVVALHGGSSLGDVLRAAWADGAMFAHAVHLISEREAHDA